MYDHFFKLTAEPFRLSPDHRFCYKHAKYGKAMAYMAYAFMRREGFVMITGQPGTGKTTLIGNLIESLADENVTVGKLVSTQLAADDLLRMVAFSFGVEAESAEKSQILQNLTTHFLAIHRAGGRALLIVDEAQDLVPSALEELRLLTNLQRDSEPLLQIFLLGQTELRDLIHSSGLEQVHQRIVAASHLESLQDSEVRAYVEHRLQVVGWNNDPAISVPVYQVIALFSEGIPRRINLICSRLFLHACVEQRHRISVADAKAVVTELQEEQLSTRNLLNNEIFFAEDFFDNPLPQLIPEAKPESKSTAGPGTELRATPKPKPVPRPTPRPTPKVDNRAAQAGIGTNSPANPQRTAKAESVKAKATAEPEPVNVSQVTKPKVRNIAADSDNDSDNVAPPVSGHSFVSIDAVAVWVSALVAVAVVLLFVRWDGFL